MKINQKGFSVVEVLIIIVIIGLIGTVGWLVYDRQKVKVNPQASTQITENVDEEDTNNSQSDEAEVPDGWLLTDRNTPFTFMYPRVWDAEMAVSDYPLDHIFELRYVGDIKLNENHDGWVIVSDKGGGSPGTKADVIEETANEKIKVWRLGFGDAGYGSFIATFVVTDKIYQIKTGSFCPESTLDCMSGSEYTELYNKFVGSIKLK